MRYFIAIALTMLMFISRSGAQSPLPKASADTTFSSTTIDSTTPLILPRVAPETIEVVSKTGKVLMQCKLVNGTTISACQLRKGYTITEVMQVWWVAVQDLSQSIDDQRRMCDETPSPIIRTLKGNVH